MIHIYMLRFGGINMNFALSTKQKQLLVIALALLLILGITCCTGKEAPVEFDPMGTVSADNLNVRKKPDADAKILGRLPIDLEIEILEQEIVDGTTWGRIDALTLPDGTKIKAGWINLNYVSFGADEEPAPTEPPTEAPTEAAPELPTVPSTMGTITAGKLNIRADAGSNAAEVGTYLRDERVEIVETKTVGDTLWGRTGRGWVGMGFVRMDGIPPLKDDGSLADADLLSSDGKYGVLGYGVVDLGSLNVRHGPGTDYNKVKDVKEGDRYAYYQIQDGWVRIEGGWVSTEYFYIEGTKAADATTGTVDTEELNIRSGPATTFKNVGTYKKGETVEILAEVGRWGYTSKGWVSMDFILKAEKVYTTGVGTISTGLNIRKEPNPDSPSAGTYTEGDLVEILEVKGHWGRTAKGWINLRYVNFD